MTAISTPVAAPVIAGIRLRAGRAASGRGAASMVAEAVNLASSKPNVLFGVTCTVNAASERPRR